MKTLDLIHGPLPPTQSDKIGRIADWNSAVGSSNPYDERRQRNAIARGTTAFGSSMAGSAFQYQHGEDEATFSLVDNARTTTFGGRGGGFGRGGRGRGGPGGGRGGRGGVKLGGAAAVITNTFGFRGGFSRGRGGFRGGRGGGGGRFRDWDRPQRTREPSVTVGSEWEQLEEIDFVRLGKLSLGVTDAETM